MKDEDKTEMIEWAGLGCGWVFLLANLGIPVLLFILLILTIVKKCT